MNVQAKPHPERAFLSEINDSTVAMWSVYFPPAMDYLAHLYRGEGGRYHFDCRTRLYKDDRVFDSRDDKQCFRCVMREEVDEAEAIERARRVYEEMLAKSRTRTGWELLKGARSVSEYAEALMQMPGMSFRKEGA